MEVLAKGYSRAYDTTQIEDGPEDTDEKALLVLRWICQHKRALCSPKQAGTDTKDGTCNNHEGAGMWMDVNGAT